jgi:biotin carboxyl carrier protein
MEHTLSAPFNATVAEVPVSLGGQVTEGAVLAKLTPG